MRQSWRNERGSALLLVLLAVTVLGLMIGGVALAVHNSGVQANAHEQQVQADYRMEQSMEIALYMLNKEPDLFQATFRDAQKTPCLINPDDVHVQVCLETTTSAEGTAVESLIVTSDNPTSVIRYTLPDKQ